MKKKMMDPKKAIPNEGQFGGWPRAENGRLSSKGRFTGKMDLAIYTLNRQKEAGQNGKGFEDVNRLGIPNSKKGRGEMGLGDEERMEVGESGDSRSAGTVGKGSGKEIITRMEGSDSSVSQDKINKMGNEGVQRDWENMEVCGNGEGD